MAVAYDSVSPPGADVAALHLVLADLLLERGEELEATREIVAALPVIDELQRGYKLRDRLLRPAMVRVATNPNKK